MAVPKKKISKRRRGKRRSHLSLKIPRLVICSNCKKKVKPHIVCSYCGFYKGKGVIEISKKKKGKSEKKQRPKT